MSQIGSKKSRKGCVRCKQRRVKCDELAPCTNCVRRAESCSLALAQTPEAQAREHGLDMALPTTSEEWMGDLELMRHYTLYTSNQPLGIQEQMQHLWREVIPQEALKYSLPDSRKYLQLCDKHQMKAIEAFRVVLSSKLTPEISTALFALASTLSISSPARAGAEASFMPEPKHINVDQVVELFQLTRGVREVIQTCHGWIHSGPLGPMLTGHEIPSRDTVRLPAAVEQRVRELHAMLERDCGDEQRPACRAALKALEDIYLTVHFYARKGPPETGHVLRFTILVPAEFVRLIGARSAPALIVLAHFAATLEALRLMWYTHLVGQYILKGIALALVHDEKMLRWLEWPQAQADDGMAILTGRNPTDKGNQAAVNT